MDKNTEDSNEELVSREIAATELLQRNARGTFTLTRALVKLKQASEAEINDEEASWKVTEP